MRATDSRSTLARAFWPLAAGGLVVLALALGAAHYLEIRGHVATGMDNQVVWGLPHVFAIIMIVAGFLFVSVSAYMAGLVGSSNNPVSGITICTRSGSAPVCSPTCL